MILLALKSLFFVTAILGYSTGVWRLINNYFQQEFKTYLAEEVKKNKYLVVDPGAAGENPPAPAGSAIVTESEVKQAGRSVTANRLLDEMIVNFGRLFTTRHEPEFSRKRTPETQPKEIITSTSSRNERQGSIPDPYPEPARGGTIIESDKFPRSSSSEVDNKSDDDDDDAAGGDADDDEEEKWIKYWKKRDQGGDAAVAVEDGGGGHCEAKLDACGP